MAKLAVFLGLVLPLLLVSCDGGETVEGVISHKAVTGVKGDSAYTILQNIFRESGSSVVVKDKDYQGHFPAGTQHAVISEALENEMRREYSQLTYMVNMRVHFVADSTLPYRVSREGFNLLRVGSAARFKSSGGGGIQKIVEVLEVSE